MSNDSSKIAPTELLSQFQLVTVLFQLGVPAAERVLPQVGLHGGGVGASCELALTKMFSLTGGGRSALPGAQWVERRAGSGPRY